MRGGGQFFPSDETHDRAEGANVPKYPTKDDQKKKSGVRAAALLVSVLAPENGLYFTSTFSGLLTGKFKREDKDVAATLSGTRLGWTAEKPSERSFNISPNVEQYRENENYWKLMDAHE